MNIHKEILTTIWLILCFLQYTITEKNESDENGYLMYCPCMGRFGNQAEHFLGTLEFSRQLNRTLVLPPWIEYHNSAAGSTMVSFDEYFDVGIVKKYHRAVTMHFFFKYLVDKVWPIGQRYAFCYTARRGPDQNSCNAKDGNPFGPFWDHHHVKFDGSVMYGPLSFDVHRQNDVDNWMTKYPADRFPVLAFTGAPASFPVQEENVNLQKYLMHNSKWIKKAKLWIKNNLPKGQFVGVHLRNGIDWEAACNHVGSTNHLFSSPQCLGYRNEAGQLTKQLCLPSDKSIISQIKQVIKEVSASSIFVASDNNFMIATLTSKLKKQGVSVHKVEQSESHPHLDLTILSLSDAFIGNCVSSFTAFVKRTRDVNNLKNYFWGVNINKRKHDRATEL